MSRLWSSGFELQSVTSGDEFDTVNGSPTIDTTTKRSGAASLRVNVSSSTASIYHQFSADFVETDDIFVRFYLRIATAPGTLTSICQLWDDNPANARLSVRLNANRTLELWDDYGGGTPAQIGSDSSALSLDTWYRIECAYKNSDTKFALFIDGTSVVDAAANTEFSQPARLQLGVMTSTTADLYFDDVACNISTGTYEVGYPGEGKIVHLMPNAAGDNNPTAGDWDSVDEVPPSDADDMDLDETTTIADLNCASSSSAGIGAGDAIKLVQVGIRARREGTSGANSYQTRIKSQASGTVVTGTTTSLNASSFQTHDDVAPRVYKLTSYTNPQGTGGWTPTLLDTMQIGVTPPDATPDLLVSSIWALVAYIPASENCSNTNSLVFEAAGSETAYASVSGTDGITALTVELWFKPESLVTNSALVCNWKNDNTDNKFMFRLDGVNSDELKCFIASSLTDTTNVASTSDANLAVGTWYHLALVYDGSQAAADRVKFYRDGTLLTSAITGTIPTALTSTTDDSVYLASKQNGANFQDGWFDEVRIWNTARTQAEIQANMSKQLNGDETGLLAYWKLNNSYANAVAGGNSLTIVGFPFFSVDTPFCESTVTAGVFTKTLLGVGL